MWQASKAKKKKSKWTGRYWFSSASDWLREWLEFPEPFRERGKAKSRQSQMKSLLTFFFKLKLYKGKHVSSKKKHPLFQAITFLFLIMSFCLFVFRCLNSRLYFQSGSCCFFYLTRPLYVSVSDSITLDCISWWSRRQSKQFPKWVFIMITMIIIIMITIMGI